MSYRSFHLHSVVINAVSVTNTYIIHPFKCVLSFCLFVIKIDGIIVIIRNWLGNPANFKETNKEHKFYVGRSTTLHNLLSVLCSHILAELRNRHVSIG